MNIKLQIFIILVLRHFHFLMLQNLLRRKKIDFRYALGWIALELIILGLTVFPNTLAWLSGQIGIASPVNMLFFLRIVLSFVYDFFIIHFIKSCQRQGKKISTRVGDIKENSI